MIRQPDKNISPDKSLTVDPDFELNTSSGKIIQGISGIFKRLIRDEKPNHSPTKTKDVIAPPT